MKKIFTILFAVAFIGAMTVSCQEDCKNCKTVTKDSNGNIVQEGSASEYCDTDLDTKENTEPVSDGSTTTTWVCE